MDLPLFQLGVHQPTPLVGAAFPTKNKLEDVFYSLCGDDKKPPRLFKSPSHLVLPCNLVRATPKMMGRKVC